MLHGERGTSLLEAIAATVVAIFASLGMIFALSSGHMAIKSQRLERAALFLAQQKVEKLLAKPSNDPDLGVGSHGPETGTLPNGSATTTWNVTWVDDALDGAGMGDTNPQDYRKLEVTVAWNDAIARNVKLSTFVYP